MQQSEPQTFWESVRHNTKWGQYITSVEHQALATALSAVQRPSVALEVGTDGGYWANLLVEAGMQVICTDIDAQALAVVQKRVPSARCLLVSPRTTTLPCPAASVQLIMCFEVFPVIHSAWFYEEAQRILKPGGVIVGVAQNRNSVRSYANKLARVLDPKNSNVLEEPFLYTLGYREWKHQLRRTGFSLVHEEGLCWLPFPRKSNFALIPQLTHLEERVGLRKVPHLSPWIAFVAQQRPLKT